MIVLPSQFGRILATSRCSRNGIAKMIVAAASASRSDLATTVGPIARAGGANAAGGRRLATVTAMAVRAKGWASAWPILPNPMNAELIMFHQSGHRFMAFRSEEHTSELQALKRTSYG